ncbi:MAG TPA: lipopolysaccharide biosynthesis protein [Rhodanobacteraceae bacterium]|nr:lipopolysaccharide biosynthesis protein [Rhodanobacteraceae bacterium]
MNLLPKISGHRLAHNTVLATGWQAIRVALQAVWVILLARTIGPGDYGSFAGMAGLAAALGALTGLGFGMLMIQDASRNHERFAPAWKRALVLTLASGLALWGLYVITAPLLFRVHNVWLYAAIGLPELVCLPVTLVASYAFQLHERMGWAGVLFSLSAIGNLIAVVAFLGLSPQHALRYYLPFHAALSVLASVGAVGLVLALLAPAKARFEISRRDVREGMGFSLMRIADTGMTSLDKTLVLLLAGNHVAGIYGSAYRLVAVLAMPATSLGMAALPRLFQIHATGTDAPARKSGLVAVLLAATAAYGVIAALLAYVLSGVLPMLFGPAFAQAAQAARWLAISPLLYGLYALGCNVLVTSHRRTLRIVAQAAGIAILAITALIWIPRFGLKGAVGMLLFSQGATALLLWLLVRWNRRAGSPHPEAIP